MALKWLTAAGNLLWINCRKKVNWFCITSGDAIDIPLRFPGLSYRPTGQSDEGSSWILMRPSLPLLGEKVPRTTSVITAARGHRSSRAVSCGFVLVAAEDFRPSAPSISPFLRWFRNQCKEAEWRKWPGHPLWSPGSCRRRPTEYWSLCWRPRRSCRCTSTVSPAGSVRCRAPRGACVTLRRRNFIMLACSE